MFPGLVRWNKHSHPRVSRGSRRNAGGRCKSKVLMRRVKTRQSGVLLGHCAVSPNETKSHQRLFLAKRCRMGRTAGVLSEPPPHPGRLQRVQPAKAPTRRRPGREAGLLLLGGGFSSPPSPDTSAAVGHLVTSIFRGQRVVFTCQVGFRVYKVGYHTKVNLWGSDRYRQISEKLQFQYRCSLHRSVSPFVQCWTKRADHFLKVLK